MWMAINVCALAAIAACLRRPSDDEPSIAQIAESGTALMRRVVRQVTARSSARESDIAVAVARGRLD
jgi:hypothetical protein